MKYELAKELKDAGFPQLRHYEIKDYLPEPLPDGSYDPNDFVAVPTLEELIEACGPYFWDLVCNVGVRRGEVVVQNAEWVADARIDNITATGDTPLEAVARLWLAINKKP